MSGKALLKLAGLGAALAAAWAAGLVWRDASQARLSDIVDPNFADAERAAPAVNLSTSGARLTVGGKHFRRGVGVQTETAIAISLEGAERFTALVGVDDATPTSDAVVFAAQADGETLWRSEPLRRGQPPLAVELDLRGKKQLVLVVEDVGHAMSQAHADWIDAVFHPRGVKPVAARVPVPAEEAVILTPPPAATPRINSARVFGVRPGHPFLYTIAATGERPMTFAAENLPAGLMLDRKSGRITGVLAVPGTHVVGLRASNARGSAEIPLHLEVGEEIALTPPLGWNSWNVWGSTVDHDKVLAAARAMVESGLRDHGWTYVNIDDGWQTARGGPLNALQGNTKFPDLAGLCDAVHDLGLKIGIYSTPWVTSYAVYPGSTADNSEGAWVMPGPKERYHPTRPWYLGDYSFATEDARQWAAWGFDYLKYDWTPNRVPETEEMARALRASGRDIAYSISNSTPYEDAAALSALTNVWRTTGDITDTWGSILRIGFSQAKWARFSRPGHWNDPDMLVVGHVGWSDHLAPTRLTPNEQYLHISLWSLLSAPLLIGCDMTRLDAFTLGLLTNDEVLAINQDPLAAPTRQVVDDGRRQVWSKAMEDGSVAVGLFNLSRRPDTVSVTWAQLGFARPSRARDVWTQQDFDPDADGFSAEIPRHGVRLIRLWPAQDS